MQEDVGTGKMTPRQALFVEEYVRDRNATQAAIRAGYAPKSAGKTAWEMLHHPRCRHVQEAIVEACRDLARSTREIQENLRRRWTAIALADIRDLYTENDRGEVVLRKITELPPEVAAGVREVRQTTFVGPDGEPASTVTLKMYSGLEAGKLLATHLGMLKTQVDVSGTLDLDSAEAELSRAFDSLRANREEIAGVLAGAIARAAEGAAGGAEPEG